jgi:hypothetical protein
MTENRHDEMKQMLDNILNEDITLNIPLEDLIWAIINYSYMMRDIEDELFSNYPHYPNNLSPREIDSLANNKEYTACRRDELARIIGQYSDFDTSKIWESVDSIFRDYSNRLSWNEFVKGDVE